jgi:WD40 repeat protein
LQTTFQRRANEQLLLSPDRTRLIAVGDGNRLITVVNGKGVVYVGGARLPELCIELLELPTGRLLKQLARNTPETVFSDVALSPDGKLLAVGIRAYKAPRKLLRLIDAASGEVVREIKGEGEGWFLSVAFTADGKTLALGSKDEIALVDVATGKLVEWLKAKMSTVAFLGFGPDAKTVVSHSHDDKVRLWDLATKKIQKLFDAEAGGYGEPAIASSGHGQAAIFEVFGKTNATALTLDGKTLAVGTEFGVRLWDVVAETQLFSDQTPADAWGNVAFSPDGRRLLVGNWKNSRIWDSVTGALRKELPVGAAFGVFSPDGQQVAFARYQGDGGKEAPVVSIWDIANGKELFRLEHPRKKHVRFGRLGFSPDGQNLLTLSVYQQNAGFTDSAMVHRWDTRTGKLLRSINRKDTYAWSSAIAPDGRTAAIVLSPGLLLTDVENDEDLWTRADGAPEGWSGYPVFSPDGGFLFVWSSDGYVALWEIATRSVIARLCLRRDGNVKMANSR